MQSIEPIDELYVYIHFTNKQADAQQLRKQANKKKIFVHTIIDKRTRREEKKMKK